MENDRNALVVEMKDIVKTFPGTKALDGVCLKLRRGEIHALIGENGAGKSTLMNVLTGQFSCDSGEICMEGVRVSFSSPKEALRKNIVLVPQELNLVPEASIKENVFLGNERISRGLIDWEASEREAERLLELLDVHLDVSQPVKTLSAAHQQLVSIARALAYAPKVLILDEPTAVLTNKEADSLFSSMHRLKAQGTAIVFISHHLDEVAEQCDRVTIMRDGCLVEERLVADIDKDEMISKMAGRKVVFTQHTKRSVGTDVFLETAGLSRKHEFHDISFRIHEGEILCVTGLVGAGRTEIFRCIFGITEKDAGKIFIKGNEVQIRSPRDAIRHGMGYVSEERRHDGIMPNMSVMENMLLLSYDKMKRCGLLDWLGMERTAKEYIQSFKIKTASHQSLIKNLSGGNQQKVIVARWLAKGIQMLILDEPTRGIDVNAKGEIHKLIRNLADSGVAVVVISSEMEEVLALADRIMVVQGGRIRGFLENEETLQQEDILKVAFQ